jgi:hypothetical protein
MDEQEDLSIYVSGECILFLVIITQVIILIIFVANTK